MNDNNVAFVGKWITIPFAAEYKPQNVFHREIDDLVNGKIVKSHLAPNLHVLFRDKFTVESSSETCIKITADDYYKLFINGVEVSQGPAPGFDFCYYYNTIDITDYVHVGENTIAVHTFYQGLVNRVWVSADDRHGLIYDIVQNGVVTACSDENVKCSVHDGFEQIGLTFEDYDTQFLERYDSRGKCIGFENSEFDDSDWQRAVVHPYADYTLVPQPTSQLEVYRIEPQTVRYDQKGIFVDFGACYVGYPAIRAKASNGDKVIIRCAQELDDDGEVMYNMRCSVKYEDEWILSGEQDTLNQYDYKSFRYMRLIVPDGCEIFDIAMIIRHYPFKRVRDCKYQDAKLQRVFDLCAESLHYGMQDKPQDCDDREKGQYSGDGVYITAAHAILTGESAMMEKFLDNILSSSFVDGGLLCLAPCAFMQEITEYSLMLPMLAYIHYVLNGKSDFVVETYYRLEAMMDHFKSAYSRDDGLLTDIDKWCVIDWPKNARDNYDFDTEANNKVNMGIHNVPNAHYANAVWFMNKISREVLGGGDYADYTAIKKAYIDAFYDEQSALFKDTPVSNNKSFPSNAAALLAGLAPDETCEKAVTALIMNQQADRTSFLSVFAALGGLARIGDEEHIKEIIGHEDRWLRMLSEGATRLFEVWYKDLKWNTSLFHLITSYAVWFLTDWGIEKVFHR